MSKITIIALLIVVAIAVSMIVYYFYLKPTPVKKVLRVGTSPDFPPFEFINETTNEIVGIDIDLVKLIAKKIGYEVEIVPIDFDGLIPALQAGQIDLIASGMTITEERAKVVDFSIPYWEANQAIIVVRGGQFKPRGLEDLVGKTVGVQTGTTAEILITDYINKTNANIQVKSYSSYILATQDLLNGRLDAVIVDEPVAQALQRKYNVEISASIETGEKYGLAIKKGNAELLNAVNKALNEILNSQEWYDIISKYTG
ncbi:MAG: basic amino acid ABC transporter substrate-binding protein [Desulfurococcaceae archaeon]